VTGLSPDAPVAESSYAPGDDPYSVYIATTKIGTSRTPNLGSGIGVALIDTGLSATAYLGNTHIVQGPDLSFDSSSPQLAHLDAYGHGTHMGGIIAGNDPGASSKPFYGVAPNATLINVKVGAANGAADVSQVIAGIDWVVQHRNDPGLNIKVINLSLGYLSTQPYTTDPLAYAAEQAWFNGITVVAAAGNRGSSAQHLDSPAYDPYVIAVGAANWDGTNYSVPSFSSVGNGVRNPDLLAPGGHIASLSVPNSFVMHQNPSGSPGAGYMRGSGTSQAAAMVSGAVADALSQNPGMSPDRVKGILVKTAHPIAGYSPNQEGAGTISVYSAADDWGDAVPAQTWTRSTGTGSLDATRNGSNLTLNGVTLTGNTDVFGKSINLGGLASAEASGSTWSGGAWNGSTWSGSTWSGSTWSGSTWSGSTWSGSTWSGSTWSGSTWSGATWSGSTWSGVNWSGSTWSNGTWSSDVWSTASWS
jgi:serine protease AprX